MTVHYVWTLGGLRHIPSPIFPKFTLPKKTMPTPTLTTLLAFANDADTPLRELAAEQDEIQAAFQQAKRDGKCEVVALADATPEKLIQAFQDNAGRIRIFHYGGHSNQDAIFLRGPYRQNEGVKTDNLAEFLALQEGLELVFLNGCLSLEQARKYHESGVKAVVATNRKVGDEAARRFAQLFYRELAAGADIEMAFKRAEKGFKVLHQGRWRDEVFIFEGQEARDEFPWELFPPKPALWRLPLVAKRLTRIPTIGLEKEFLGREADMQRLKETLDKASRVVLMSGLGGVGKTSLAAAYVQQFGDKYDHLAWVNRGDGLIGAVALDEYLSDTLGIPFEEDEKLEARFRRILRKLQQLPGRNLLVADNAQEQIAQKEIYEQLPGPPNWKVLLTSRLSLGGFEEMRLETLAPEAARALFRAYYQGPCSEKELEGLLQEIGYHTLTTELLAKLLDKFNGVLSLSELTEALRKRQLDDPGLQEQVWARHSGEERGIYMHLMKAFELAQLSGQEQWLLKQFVVLPTERYPVAMLADFLQEKPLELNTTLNGLAAKGWVTRHEDKTFSAHRLIRQVAEYQLRPTLADVEALLTTIARKMHADAYTNPIKENAPWLSYATSIAYFFVGGQSEGLATLQHNIAEAYRPLGQYSEALAFHQNALAARNSLLDAQHPSLGDSYHNTANTFYNLGQFEEALKYHEKALAIRESGPDPQKYRLAYSYNNIALTYRGLKQYEKALAYHQKALAIRKEVLEEPHPDIAASYMDIGVIYRAMGKYEEALNFHKKALEAYQAAVDAHHPCLARAHHNKALSCSCLKRYDDALHHHHQALVIRELTPNARHPDLAVSYTDIAETYRALGQKDKAAEFQTKVEAIKALRE